MKCTNCGCKELFKTDAFVPMAGYGEVKVEAFACAKCGHVECFVPEKTIQRYYTEIEQKKAKEKRKEQSIADAQYLEKEIRRLEIIVADENQTVKVVREAEAALNECKSKLAFVKKGNLMTEYRKGIESFYLN